VSIVIQQRKRKKDKDITRINSKKEEKSETLKKATTITLENKRETKKRQKGMKRNKMEKSNSNQENDITDN
jgi:hypothetical protein